MPAWHARAQVSGSRGVQVGDYSTQVNHYYLGGEASRHRVAEGRALRAVTECDPIRLGVHPAIQLPLSAGSAAGLDRQLPSYARRDADAELRMWLGEHRDTGGFLLLIGTSSVGKSRLLYEAVRGELPDWLLLHPGPSEAAGALAALDVPLPGLVVWLDELQAYLEGPWLPAGAAVLTPEAVAGLLDDARPVIIVATMWTSQYWALHQNDRLPGIGDRPRYPLAHAVLAQAGHPVVIADQLSPAERSSAAEVARYDPRIAQARSSPDFGVTQTLAGAPWLARRWEAAPDEESRAILTAAIDMRRLGLYEPLTEEILGAAARAYLASPHPGDEWAGPALAGLATIRSEEAATAPLLPVTGPDHRHASGYEVADYLLQYGARVRRCTPVPAYLWQVLAERLTSPAALARLAGSAQNRSLLQQAEVLYRHAIELGGQDANLPLAAMLGWRQRRIPEATAAWRAAVAAGAARDSADLAAVLDYRASLGIHEASADRQDQWLAYGQELAEKLSMYADISGREILGPDIQEARQPGSFAEKASKLEEQGDLSGAEQAWRAAISDGHLTAYGKLGALLTAQGRMNEHLAMWREANDAGHPNAWQGVANAACDFGATVLAARMRRWGLTADASDVQPQPWWEADPDPDYTHWPDTP